MPGARGAGAGLYGFTVYEIGFVIRVFQVGRGTGTSTS